MCDRARPLPVHRRTSMRITGHKGGRLTALLWLALASAAISPTTNAQSVPGPAYIVDTGELMQTIIRPAYQELQSAVAKPPASRQEWAVIYRAAVRLAEMENLIFFRESNRYTTQPEFPAFAMRARETTAQVAKLTLAAMPSPRDEDFTAVRTAYESVSVSCTACHRGVGTMNGPTVKP